MSLGSHAALHVSKPVHEGSAPQLSTCVQQFAYAQVLHVGLSSAGPASWHPGGRVPPESPLVTGLPSPVVPPPSLGVHVSPAGHAASHVSPGGHEEPEPLPLPHPAASAAGITETKETSKTKLVRRIREHLSL